MVFFSLVGNTDNAVSVSGGCVFCFMGNGIGKAAMNLNDILMSWNDTI